MAAARVVAAAAGVVADAVASADLAVVAVLRLLAAQGARLVDAVVLAALVAVAVLTYSGGLPLLSGKCSSRHGRTVHGRL
jgi:hypothetical protein